MRDCQLETVDAGLFRALPSLQLVDFTSNHLKHLSAKITLHSPQLGYIGVANNPLVCDCDLLWFKKFLLRNARVYKQQHDDAEKEEQTCVINVSKQLSEAGPLLAEQKFIDLVPAADYSRNVHSSPLLSKKKSRSSAELDSQKRSVPISRLADEQFICELDVSGSVQNVSSSVVELKCRVKSYPRASVRWMFGQRVLDRLYLIDNKKFRIDEQLEVNNMEPYSFVVKSKLFVAYSGSLKDVGREEFSCRASHAFSKTSGGGNGDSFKAEPIYEQKMVLFVVNSNKIVKGRFISNLSCSICGIIL